MKVFCHIFPLWPPNLCQLHLQFYHFSKPIWTFIQSYAFSLPENIIFKMCVCGGEGVTLNFYLIVLSTSFYLFQFNSVLFLSQPPAVLCIMHVLLKFIWLSPLQYSSFGSDNKVTLSSYKEFESYYSSSFFSKYLHRTRNISSLNIWKNSPVMSHLWKTTHIFPVVGKCFIMNFIF